MGRMKLGGRCMSRHMLAANHLGVMCRSETKLHSGNCERLRARLSRPRTSQIPEEAVIDILQSKQKARISTW